MYYAPSQNTVKVIVFNATILHLYRDGQFIGGGNRSENHRPVASH